MPAGARVDGQRIATFGRCSSELHHRGDAACGVVLGLRDWGWVSADVQKLVRWFRTSRDDTGR
ncbi:hypothetical protein B0H10DRAFT_2007083 [Mycena sp. CBHHK59/15]|nr:hypothetical protein B0H10DRAFT_2007083 [Mycena sp. CBHHK59/15]